MSEKLQAILFLGFTALFILGFVFAVFYLITKSISSNSKIRQMASQYEWYYYKNDKIHSESLNHLINKLENTLYKTRSGLKHDLSQILNGHYNSIEFWFSHYHASSQSHMAGKGYSQNLSLYILPRTQKGSDILLLWRTKIMRALPIEQIVKKIGGNLEVPDNHELDWLLVSDKAALQEMKLTDSQYHEIKNDFKEMYGIYFFNDIIVYMIHNYRSPKDILKYLDNVYRINSIVNP